jgi:hypothetical protein
MALNSDVIEINTHELDYPHSADFLPPHSLHKTIPNSDIIQIIPCGSVDGQQRKLGVEGIKNQSQKSAHQLAHLDPPQAYVTILEGQ